MAKSTPEQNLIRVTREAFINHDLCDGLIDLNGGCILAVSSLATHIEGIVERHPERFDNPDGMRQAVERLFSAVEAGWYCELHRER